MAPKYKAFLIALLLSVGLDQGTKIWARHELAPRYPAAVTVIPHYFELQYSENFGTAFSVVRQLPAPRVLSPIFGVAALLLVGYYLRKVRPDALRLGVELGLVAGGAIGNNLIDRIAFGRVTDFVVWRIGSHAWPTFNIADAALVLGIAGLLLDWPSAPASRKEERAA